MQLEESKKEKCPKDHSKLPQKLVTTEGKNYNRPYVRCTACTFFEWQDQDSEKVVEVMEGR